MHSYPPRGEGVKAIIPQKFFPKMQSYPSPQFYKSFPCCRKRFVPIMQNLYKSFPTNESLLFLFSLSLSLSLSLFIFHFMFGGAISFYSFYFFFLFLLRVFFFLFQNLKFFPKGENVFPSIWGNNRRIDAHAGRTSEMGYSR